MRNKVQEPRNMLMKKDKMSSKITESILKIFNQGRADPSSVTNVAEENAIITTSVTRRNEAKGGFHL